MDRLRIVTLNIWNREGPWEERLALIRAGVAELAPDLMGLQEVLRFRDDRGETGQDLEIGREGGYHVAFGVATDLGHGLAFGNALLSRFPIVDQNVIPLPGTDVSDQARSVLFARVRAPFGDVPVFVTHFNWKFHESAVRVAQARAVVEIMERLSPYGVDPFPPILMGDLNAEPESDEIRYLTGLATIEGKSVHFADAWAWAGDGTRGYTFDDENGFARRSHAKSRRLDYILVRGSDFRQRGEPLAARVVLDRASGGVWPSDHYGVLAELSV